MKLVNSYKAVTIESALTKEDVAKCKKYAPKALTLLNEDKAPIFGIGVSKSGHGCINDYGIEFSETTAEGKLYVTVPCDKLPDAPEARHSFLQEEFGAILFRLGALETQVTQALSNLAANLSTVAEAIIIQ